MIKNLELASIGITKTSTKIGDKRFTLKGFDFETYPATITFLEYNEVFPHTWHISKDPIIFDTFMTDLVKEFPNMNLVYSNGENFDLPSHLCFAIENRIFIDIDYISENDLGGYSIDDKILDSDKIYSTNSVMIIYNPEFEDDFLKIKDICYKNTIKKSNENVFVGFITLNKTSNQFSVKEFNINKKMGKFEELDLHYGKGFDKYYKDLIKLIKNNTKGLVLFHGAPGTGKTYCIKNLMKDLSQEGKSFIYVAADMVANIMQPDFITFITNYALEEDNNIILIIEDAEELLLNRDEHSGIGVTNILNMTDGILNDILGFQVIATFNTRSKIDTALLRSGRLLSKKEFSVLPKTRAELLIKHLGSDIKVRDGMTLSDIYSYKNTNDILTHELDELDDTNEKYIL